METYSLGQRALAETLGTALLVLVGPGSVVATLQLAGDSTPAITGADPAYPQRVVGNAVFAATPLYGGQQSNNVTDTYNSATNYLASAPSNQVAPSGSSNLNSFSAITGFTRSFENRKIRMASS